MRIKNVEFQNRAFLAPMAGVADRAFREICVQWGAAYTVSEMVSAKALTMHDKKSMQLMEMSPAEHPRAIQLFGNEPQVMAEAAAACMAFSPDIIDINMGCPAPKIAQNGSGSALMKDPVLAGQIVSAVSRAVPVPVTVKIRKGWDDTCLTALDVALAAQENGAAAVTLHGRTRKEMYSGRADWAIIRTVKQALSIPVIGNGDVRDEQSAAQMLEQTGCDAVMIGRGALGNPFVFARINAYLNECRVLGDVSVSQKMVTMLEQIQKAIDYKGEYVAMREARHHAAYYTKGLRGGAAYRRQISQLEHFEQLQELAFEIVKENA
ncbi:MAG TPA: tRNA dihydrouridine synthase DusB [Candidatus Scubalenecus merdavium]|uniref:tRNA-dihydrouridine synthase n=1 Tax=Candidatus Scybalenecus merdavium TaxID=2840939 RepID=A0A9D1SP61_9FIRM|nr:tRNA dihydrouridine synthase DusB [Candidatus Scubalenecus merdavium]